MGCDDIARFDQRGLKTTLTLKLLFQNLLLGTLRGGNIFIVFRKFFRKVVKKQIFYCQADWWFLGPSYQNEVYHAPLLYKIWDLGERIFLVEDPLNKKWMSPVCAFCVQWLRCLCRTSEGMDTRQWIQDNADNNWVLDDTNYDNFIIRKALNRGRGS